MDRQQAAAIEKALTKVAHQADMAVFGVAELVAILRSDDRITDAEARRVVDAMATQLPMGGDRILEQAVQNIVPGYKTARNRQLESAIAARDGAKSDPDVVP